MIEYIGYGLAGIGLLVHFTTSFPATGLVLIVIGMAIAFIFGDLT